MKKITMSRVFNFKMKKMKHEKREEFLRHARAAGNLPTSFLAGSPAPRKDIRMASDSDWKELSMGNVVQWNGLGTYRLYIVHAVRLSGAREGVDLIPIDRANVMVCVSHTFPLDREEEIEDEYGEINTVVTKAVRLEGIKYIASNVKEFIMGRLDKKLFGMS